MRNTEGEYASSLLFLTEELNQLERTEARMAIAADDDVVVDGDAELLACLDDPAGHVDIGHRRSRIAGRVVVHEHDGARGKLERPLDHLARIDGRVVDRALLLHLIGDELVLAVEEQDAEL